jgi:hypothetical protein
MAERIITLPTLHSGQVGAFKLKDAEGKPARFRVIRCGRRWGKTSLAKVMVSSRIIRKRIQGYFVPAYKYQTEVYDELLETLHPIVASHNKTEGVIKCITGGRVEFWTLENESAGRSRKYHDVYIDEAAFTKPNMMDIWNRSIQPTLLDYRGTATALSNANGVDPGNFLWKLCNESEHGFTEFHAPTSSNPFMPKDELLRLERERPPLVWKQEYLAEFVDWSGTQFFKLENLLDENGNPVEYPKYSAGVFAVIDSATKTGKDNDGTAVIFCARGALGMKPELVILDYDICQIEGALLEHWLPNVFSRLEELAIECGAQMGSLGVWIEDKASGMVLLQQGARRGWNTHSIDSKLTSVGKAERAISVSGYVYQGKVKFSRRAHEKTLIYKGASRNHLMQQVLTFTLGVKDTGEDDLLDCFCYSIAIALGDQEGF